MGFKIIYGNLLEQQVDAIVNTTNRRYSGGGGVDYLIHKAEGPSLRRKTAELPHLHLGEAKFTTADVLPCKYIIHTSGPTWRYGSYLETSLLGSCYRNSIALARHLGCRTIAFPLICSKSKRFPKDVALTTAVDAIKESLAEADDIEVSLVIYREKIDPVFNTIIDAVQDFIEENYESQELDDLEGYEDFENILCCEEKMPLRFECPTLEPIDDYGALKESTRSLRKESSQDDDYLSSLISFDRLVENPTAKNLEDIELCDDFAKTLSKLLEDSDIKNKSELYLAIGMSKTGFWKIQTGKSNPTKMTVFALAIELRLNLDQTADLLMRAGYGINRSSLREMAIAAMINKEIYDRNIIDQTLYDLDLEPLPGSVID